MTQLTTQSLAEQLKLTDRRIAGRKQLFGITSEDQNNMLASKTFIDDNLDLIIERFYEQLLQYPEIQLVVGDSETLFRLKRSLRGYIQELFSGVYDALYVNTRLRVGKIHKRIGVPPSLYMSAVYRLLAILNGLLENQCRDNKCSRLESEARKISLFKVLMFDVHFIFETYTGALLAEVEAAQLELEAYAEELEQTVARRTQELKDLSRQDGLTGLLNQRAFYDHLRNDLALGKRRSEVLTLVYFDLNGFKLLNDTHGHKVGDQILAHVGECLLSTVRDVDSSCRYGGDEFCIILPGSSSIQALEVCQRLVKCFDAKVGDYTVSFSLGMHQSGPGDFISSDDLVKAADKRMYAAKAKSKKNPGYWACDHEMNLHLLQSTEKAQENSDETPSAEIKEVAPPD
ncbi:MAG: GGDEF domain-containing protein [Magnetococcales bacterium]|nr:GGDEF domain-containing protein [Magnetococcales bacterium]